MMTLAAILLPSLLRENTGMLFKNFHDEKHPQILCVKNVGNILEAIQCNEFSIVVDDHWFAETTEFLSAVRIWFSTYYLFNISYPKCLEATLTFLQKEVINLQDSAPNLTKVISLITKIKKSI